MVVGARVAGATLAALLGDAGHRVLLADRGGFPSPTLSTHYFRGARTGAVLRRLGLLADVLALGPPPLRYEYSFGPDRDDPMVQPPSFVGDLGYALSVRRGPLDHLLVRRATQAPGVELSERTRAVGLLWDRGRVVGAHLVGPAGARSVRARVVVGADGRHSTVARAVGAPLEHHDPPTRALYYRYVRGWRAHHGGPIDGMEAAWEGDELAYAFPSDGGLTCLALSVNLRDYARLRRAPAAVFRARWLARRGAAARFAAAVPEGRLLGCGPEANYVRVPAGPGWALVGDAGLHQDPWIGHGIDLAVVHATFLAEALDGWFRGACAEAVALADFHRRRNAMALEQYHLTVELAKDLWPIYVTRRERAGRSG